MKNTETPESPRDEQNRTSPDLKSVRESQGLTLKEIYKRTRISITNLEAIENSQFHILPPPVFTKSFIKTYAKIIGVNDKIILSRYEQYLETLREPSREPEMKKHPRITSKHLKICAWGVFTAFIAALVVFSLYSYKSDMDVLKNHIGKSAIQIPAGKPADTTSAQTEVSTGPTDQAIPSANPQEKDAQTYVGPETQPREQQGGTSFKQDMAPQEAYKPKKAAEETYQVTMKAREMTWLRIAADQNPVYEILLRPGEEIEMSGSKFVIDVGNAGGTDIEFQGKSLGKLGEPGQVVHLKLP